MDQTFLKQKRKKEKRSKKKKKKDRVKREIPEETIVKGDDIDDIVTEEINETKLRVTKEQPGSPTKIEEDETEEEEMIDEADEQQEESIGLQENLANLEPVQVVQPVQQVQQQIQNDPNILSGTEILSEIAERSGMKSNSSKGDYGAAYQSLYKQLCIRMINRIHNFFQRLYKKSKNHKNFKKELVNISRWDQRSMNKRAKEMVNAYPDIEDYFRYAYASQVLVISVVVQNEENSNEVEIEVPKFSEFVKKSYVQSARCLYNNVGVLDPKLPDTKKLKLREYLFQSYGKAIQAALQMMVPLKSIIPKNSSKAENYDDASDLSESSDSEADSEEEKEDEDDDDSSEESSESDDESSEESSEDSESDDNSEADSSESESDSDSESDDEDDGSHGFEQIEKITPEGAKVKKTKISKKALETPDEFE
tara:strand:- start:1691 stop:2959 length:1269 start_codon:yes stop_codon:yes gene_type:complete